MKKLQKILAMLMVLALALSMAVVTSFAAGEGSIEITNAVDGQTYTVYQMAVLESASGDNYSYEVVPAWESFFTSQGISVSEGYIHYSGTLTALQTAQFAKDAVAYAIANQIPATGTATAANGVATITDLELGYYCVDSSVGTVCSLTTANKAASIKEKNNIPVINKFVQEDSVGTYSKSNDDSIGETVNFKSEINVTNGAINYVITDTMSAGLTMGEILGVTHGTTSLKYTAAINGTDTWEATMNSIFGEGEWDEYADCTFVVALDNEDLAKITSGSYVTLAYTATINENAVIGVEGNPNETTLIYGDDLDVKSEPSETITYVWDAGVFKYTGSTASKIPLAGAIFELYEELEGELVKMHFVQDTTATVPTYVHTHDTTGTVTQITTDANGKFKIEGLDSGKYYLREVEAPDGYNKLTSDVIIEVVKQGSYDNVALTYRVEGAVDGYVGVLNQSGVLLPETGGTGTAIFVAVGSILVLGMGLLLVVKKRMTKVEFVK